MFRLICDMEETFMNNENPGFVRISEDVVVTVATAAINDVKGVEEIKPSEGFIKNLFVKEEPVKVRIIGDVIEIDAEVVLKQGYNAVLTGEKIQNAVKSEIQAMTGITVSKVNVVVTGVSFDKSAQ